MESKVEKSSPALRFWNWLQAMFFIEWIRRHVYIYNVTFGLYMLELWEQVLFNVVVLFLLSAVSYKVCAFAVDLYRAS